MAKRIMPLVSLAVLAAAAPRGVLGTPRMEGTVDVEGLLKQVNSELKRVGDDVKKTAEEALKQSKDAGTLSAEVKQAADRGLVQLNALAEAAKKLEDKASELDGRTKDVEQKIADLKQRGGRDGSDVKSLGEVVTEDEALKQYTAKGAKGSISISVNQAITSLTGSAGDLIRTDRDPEIVGIPRRRMTIRQLVQPGRTSSNMVEYAKLTTRTNNAAVVTETVRKPESAYVWTLADAPVRTIAHFIYVSRQAIDDIPQLRSEIDGELRYGLDYAEEVELLTGSGSGQHLSGMQTSGNYTAFSRAFTPTAPVTLIDDLRLAILQVVLNEYQPDGMVLHPTDWARIELTKDGENRYIWANPRSLGVQTLWGLPVVDTQAQTVDKFLVGAFKMAAKIYDRMDAEVLLSSENEDNFVKNMYTIRAEKRLAFAVKRPAALVYGDFGNHT